MKKLMVLAAVLLMGLISTAQEAGIQFNKGAKWSDVLAKAQSEKKLIFMDAYAVWCGPCKMMDKDVFTQSEVGDFFNKNFINVKFDMEKGEGLNLAQQYAVMAYPTFLFIDGNGKVMHRVVGYFEPDALLEVGNTALDPANRLAGLEARYDAGDRDPTFVADLLTVFENAMHPRIEEVVNTYLAGQSDWSTPENMDLIVNNLKSTNSKLFDYVVRNHTKFEETYGQYQVWGLLQGTILNEAFVGFTEMPSLEAIRSAFFGKVPSPLADKLYLTTKMSFYRMQQDMENYAGATVEYYQQFPSNDAYELNEQAWSFFVSVENKAYLKEALKWAQKSVEIDSYYANNDTLAALYFKLGDKKNAQKTAEKAIEIAKASGEDYTETEELLKRIKNM